jgi:hypothetical protein
MNFEGLSEKLTGFNQYYESDLRERLEELEARRKIAQSHFTLASIAVVIIGIVIFAIMKDDVPFQAIFIVGGLILAFLGQRVSIVKKEAKLSVLPIICDHLEFVYSSGPRHNLLQKFENLSLVPDYNRENREDEISGTLTDVDFWLQEAKLVQVSGSGKNRTSRTVFKGLLCHFDFHKNFKGTTIGREDFTSFGNFFSGFTTVGERVRLEDPEFENKFEVYSTDQVEARHLLTPGFMQRVLDLLRLSQIKHVQFAFDDGKFYMAIESPKKFFEGGDFNLNEPEYVQNIINDIALVFDVVKTLNLTQVTKI